MRCVVLVSMELGIEHQDRVSAHPHRIVAAN